MQRDRDLAIIPVFQLIKQSRENPELMMDYFFFSNHAVICSVLFALEPS